MTYIHHWYTFPKVGNFIEFVDIQHLCCIMARLVTGSGAGTQPRVKEFNFLTAFCMAATLMRQPSSMSAKSLAQMWAIWCNTALFQKRVRIWPKCQKLILSPMTGLPTTISLELKHSIYLFIPPQPQKLPWPMETHWVWGWIWWAEAGAHPHTSLCGSQCGVSAQDLGTFLSAS